AVQQLIHSEHPVGKAPVAGDVVLAANPEYDGPQPRIAQIDMPVVTQADAARSIAAYRARRYQVLGVPPAAADVVRADPRFDRQLRRAHGRLLGRGGLMPLAFGTTERLISPGVHGLALDGLGAPRFNRAWISPA